MSVQSATCVHDGERWLRDRLAAQKRSCDWWHWGRDLRCLYRHCAALLSLPTPCAVSTATVSVSRCLNLPGK